MKWEKTEKGHQTFNSKGGCSIFCCELVSSSTDNVANTEKLAGGKMQEVLLKFSILLFGQLFYFNNNLFEKITKFNFRKLHKILLLS